MTSILWEYSMKNNTSLYKLQSMHWGYLEIQQLLLISLLPLLIGWWETYRYDNRWWRKEWNFVNFWEVLKIFKWYHNSKLIYLTNSYFNTYTKVSLSPDDKPSIHSTTPKSVHESSTYPESTQLFKDADVNDIINILHMTL